MNKIRGIAQNDHHKMKCLTIFKWPGKIEHVRLTVELNMKLLMHKYEISFADTHIYEHVAFTSY